MSQKVESRPEETSEAARQSIPAVISAREPMRSDDFPAIGAIRMIRIVIGRNAAPAWTAE
jgi:hypothetical protein